jgi:hypothetical protein
MECLCSIYATDVKLSYSGIDQLTVLILGNVKKRSALVQDRYAHEQDTNGISLDKLYALLIILTEQ